MHLDPGPVVRSLGRKPALLSLLILEIAAAVATISSLLISGAWYGQVGDRSSGLDEENLILAAFYSPRISPSAPSIAEQRRADGQRLGTVPGVQAVAAISTTSIDDKWSYPSLFRGRKAAVVGSAREASGWTIYADHHLAETLRLRFVSGAMPQPTDTTMVGPTAAVLTRCLAERLFGAIGDHPSAAGPVAGGAMLSSELMGDVPIAGVVEDVSMRIPFVPHARCVAFILGGQPHDRESRYVVRAQPGLRAEVLARLRAAFAEDAGRRFIDIRPFDSANSVSHRIGHGLVRLLAYFGGMVGLVALLGALAATSFLVAQRKRQIGIRRALGATRSDIVGYFLLESMLAVGVGSLLGVVATLGLYVFMKRVFDSIRFDVGLLTITLLVIWTATILATLIPALRAARVPPSMASRSL